MLQIFTYFVIFLTTLILSITLYIKYAQTYWKRRNVLFLTPSFPYGNTRALAKEELNFGKAISGVYNQGKRITDKYIGIYSFQDPVLVPIDLDLVKAILSKDFSYFISRGLYYNEIVDPLNAHLVNISGPKWKKIRSKCSPMFTSSKMKLMFNILVELSKELDPILESSVSTSESIDISDLMQKLMTDNIGSCAFGLNCNSFKDPNSEFREHGKMFFDSTLSEAFKIMMSIKFPFIFDYFKIPMIRPEVSNFFMGIFKETVQARIQSKEVRRDFIDLFIRIQKNEDIDGEEGQTIKDDFDDITFNELAAQAFVFFVAGLETSSSTLNFCMYELAANPNVQETLRNEIIHVLKNYGGKITYDAVVEMKYLDKVICEALRKYPPLPFLNRLCNKDYTASDKKLVIEKGVNVWISSWGIHMDERYYPNPNKFDPERFNEEEKSKRHPYSYLPFGEGPRNCIGMRFGMLQVKVALVALLRKHRYSVNPKTTIPLKFRTRGILLGLEDKVYLDVHNY